MLPGEQKASQHPEDQHQAEAIDNSFKDHLMSLRQDQISKMKTKRTKVKVQPGKSIRVEDFNEENYGAGNEKEKLNAPSTSKEDVSKKRKRWKTLSKKYTKRMMMMT